MKTDAVDTGAGSDPIPKEPQSAREEWRSAGLSWVCASSSFILLGLYLLLGLHVRLGLGHWPTPMLEDYQAPLFELHRELVRAVLLFTWFVAGPLWLVCLLIRPLRPHPLRLVGYQFATFVAGYAFIIAVMALDPTTFSAWYMD